MKKTFLLITIIIFYSIETFSCSCFIAWNDSFSRTAKNAEFVALIKVISFDEYLDDEILGHEGKMPYSMTVEIIKKYKGKESRKRIKILGDNGFLCRPYLSKFEINGHYLIAPLPLENKPNTDYEFFACWTDYLKVDISSNIASGNYSMIRNKIDLKSFEYKLKHGDWDFVLQSLIFGGVILTLIIIIRKKRNTNKN